jgi:hypothetical protein
VHERLHGCDEQGLVRSMGASVKVDRAAECPPLCVLEDESASGGIMEPDAEMNCRPEQSGAESYG